MNKLFLYAGLGLLVIAFVVKWLNTPIYCFWILLGLAISFKVIFLVISLRSKSVKVGLWLYLILAGVAMILTSLLFKNIFPIPIVRNLLFYGAISLKITGLLFLFLKKKNNKQHINKNNKFMTQHKCENCPIRAKHDKAPKSLIGRIWRWHINFCPGWKKYMKSLDDEKKMILKEKYKLK